jgi:hypothetical protein
MEVYWVQIQVKSRNNRRIDMNMESLLIHDKGIMTSPHSLSDHHRVLEQGRQQPGGLVVLE